MNVRIPIALLLVIAGAPAASAQSTASTYQGKLSDGANPANGAYDMQGLDGNHALAQARRKPTRQAGTQAAHRPGAPPLLSCEFDTVSVDARGKITSRRKGRARYYVENISGLRHWSFARDCTGLPGEYIAFRAKPNGNMPAGQGRPPNSRLARTSRRSSLTTTGTPPMDQLPKGCHENILRPLGPSAWPTGSGCTICTVMWKSGAWISTMILTRTRLRMAAHGTTLARYSGMVTNE